MAMVATGGYGRGLLAPGSDIDLLFLLPYKQTAWGESVAEAILYCLWDLGLKVGHATRSVDECIRQAKADMTIRTAHPGSALPARRPQAVRRADHALRQGRRAGHRRRSSSPPSLPSARSATAAPASRAIWSSPTSRTAKAACATCTRCSGSPSTSIACASSSELIDRGVFDRREFKMFRRCEDFLWAVRCHMHFVTGRAEERLSFDIQREIALRLGYTEHPGMKDVERFMKHYFLIAKDVGDLTAILCAELEDRAGQARAGARAALMASFARAARRAAARQRRFRRRQQPHQHRRPGRVRARSGQPDPPVPPGAEAQSGAASRRHARRRPARSS